MMILITLLYNEGSALVFPIDTMMLISGKLQV